MRRPGHSDLPRSGRRRWPRYQLPAHGRGPTFLSHPRGARPARTVRSMIRVTGLHKHFGDVHAVNGVSFEAPDGRVTGLLGPNGAGKTTTLRMLYGVMRPDQGEIRVDD